MSKIVLQKNLKNINRQKYIIDSLKKLGKQDQILVINPELIPREIHKKIKTYTPKYIAYLYDSLARCPAEHLLDLFDVVFTFDKTDSKNYGFQLITNYNYLKESSQRKTPKYDLVYLASIDPRLIIAKNIAKKLQEIGKTYHYYISGKKTWKNNLSKVFSGKEKGITYSRKRIPHYKLTEFYNEGNVILDLVRENQDGLSFRFFEAMALKKKVVTNNKTVTSYDFYNTNNILVINDDFSNLEKSFFETDYEDLPQKIYHKYIIQSWVEKVFDLSKT